MLTQQLAADDDFVKRFQQEAIMSANLHHPHVITIYDVGAVDDLHFLIMQYLEGDTLEHWVRKNGPMPLACLLSTSPSPRDRTRSRMPSSA